VEANQCDVIGLLRLHRRLEGAKPMASMGVVVSYLRQPCGPRVLMHAVVIPPRHDGTSRDPAQDEEGPRDKNTP
jgi:hypothetical protein